LAVIVSLVGWWIIVSSTSIAASNSLTTNPSINIAVEMRVLGMAVLRSIGCIPLPSSPPPGASSSASSLLLAALCHYAIFVVAIASTTNHFTLTTNRL
jgi:hypothetical protein